MSWQNSTDCFKFDFGIVNVMRSFASFSRDLDGIDSEGSQPEKKPEAKSFSRSKSTEGLQNIWKMRRIFAIHVVYIDCPFNPAIDENRIMIASFFPLA